MHIYIYIYRYAGNTSPPDIVHFCNQQSFVLIIIIIGFFFFVFFVVGVLLLLLLFYLSDPYKLEQVVYVFKILGVATGVTACSYTHMVQIAG